MLTGTSLGTVRATLIVLADFDRRCGKIPGFSISRVTTVVD